MERRKLAGKLDVVAEIRSVHQDSDSVIGSRQVEAGREDENDWKV